MPPRIARSTVSGSHSHSQQRSNKRRKKRGLDAFSIASHDNPDNTKVQQHRLGEVENDGPRRKRQRIRDYEDMHEEQISNVPRGSWSNSSGKHGITTGEVDEGSDSEGNKWRMGDVRDCESDESEIDSDEAFGDSDEERFEDFAFRGSSKNKAVMLKGRSTNEARADNEIDLNEEEEIEESSEDDDFGDEGVDLAQILDDEDENSAQSGSDSSESRHQKRASSTTRRSKAPISGSSDGSGEEHAEDSHSSESVDSDSDPELDKDFADNAQMLKDIVASLPVDQDTKPDDESEESAPSAQALLKSLQAMPNLDPSLGQSVKTLTRDIAKDKDGKPSSKVQVPLPKRQQDKLDRAAAYQKTKETLNRWVDTVKQNRRAEHLTFPLPDPKAQQPRGESRMVPTMEETPRNDLESAIQHILQSSGLTGASGKGDENKLKAAEDLETNALPIEQVMARRAELRKQRDLLFREEKRAKRIKKIKSKAYRRVHRKEREREAQEERDLLIAAGIEVPEEEKEAADRRRAEARMGARHKDSRWAKGVKQSGRGLWDEEARAGVAEMARRNEQLRLRMAGGKTGNSEDSDQDEFSDESSASDEGEFRLRESLANLKEAESALQGASRLSSLKFMQRADAARKQQNEEAMRQLHREEKGLEDESESDGSKVIGRQIFGPKPKQTEIPKPKTRRLEFEEVSEPESADERSFEPAIKETDTTINQKVVPRTSLGERGTHDDIKTLDNTHHANATLKFIGGTQSDRKSIPSDAINLGSSTTTTGTGAEPSSNGDIINGDSTQENLEEGVDYQEPGSLLPSNLELVQAAFGGDEVEEEFAKEKQELVEDEDEKIIDNTLPGWGSWTGTGLNKRDKRQAAQKKKGGRHTTKQAGIRAVDRKDASLGSRVIVSEKQVKKNQKYLAPALPHPFESRQQYERSLRLPLGPEWTTKESFQGATKPRVILKRGIIKPIQTPSL